MANDLTGQNIQNTYQRILHVGDDGLMYDGTGSLYTPISASHEITTETSSSHAISADTLGGLNTTVTELNYLDGISSAQGGYVTAMNQSVASSTGVSFTTLTLSELNEEGSGTVVLPLNATIDQPHLKAKTATTSPAILLGDNNEDIITFISQAPVGVASIDQNGGFNGIVDGGTW